MAQSNFEERIDTYEIESTNVMTGDRDRSRYLYYQLKMSMAKAKQIDIIVSFLMESGVRMLLNDMKRALDRGVKIRILTGNYLGITQPSALYLIKSELGDRVDLRLYNETSRSFHPKSYIFHYESSNEIYIGSSNISKSALTSGIEWNYRFSDTLDKKNYELFYATFEDLFLNHSIIIDDEELKRYSKAWKKPAVSRDLAKYDATEDGEDRNAENVRMLYRPRGAQIEALYALQESRMEGATKGLVYAATGIGKTYLAAFDSAKYERVLFVAHREEILKQAAVSFKNVRNSEDYGFFDGKEKDTDKSVIFASVATLGRTEYLNETYFPADYFDYVIIDEFHHAVTDQYRRIVEYFQPQFLLGLTATPERMDGKNIYEICDYNVPYQISLKEAINKGMLVPFHYYGVYDETDYSGLRIVKGRYDEQELNQAYIPETYTIYNREYPWSSGSKSIEELQWENIKVETGEMKSIIETVEEPQFSYAEILQKKYLGEFDEDKKWDELGTALDEKISIPVVCKKYTREEPMTVGLGRVLNSCQDLIWEEEFDASKEETISVSHPCAEIIKVLGLSQKKYDGYYCNKAGELIAFDTALTKQKAGLIIRKDALDEFLSIKNFHLVWFVNASKEIHDESLMIKKYTDWTGLLEYKGDFVEGEYYITEYR